MQHVASGEGPREGEGGGRQRGRGEERGGGREGGGGRGKGLFHFFQQLEFSYYFVCHAGEGEGGEGAEGGRERMGGRQQGRERERRGEREVEQCTCSIQLSMRRACKPCVAGQALRQRR